MPTYARNHICRQIASKLLFHVSRMTLSLRSATRFDQSIVTNNHNTEGLLSQTVFPDNTNTFTYLKDGLLATVANGLGTISNSWSYANRLTSQSQVAPSGTVNYNYYPAGQLSNVTSVAGTNTYALDNADRVSTVTTLRSQLSSPLTFTNSYGSNNAVAEGSGL